ncbi:U2 snRNP complex subunit [Lobaria immixta]|nr:U2 snRNP complex subunit [Lobaria immixta]
MRLTAELIQNSLSYLNPLKERELDLRGHKIPAIENLGVAKDQDAIDFTDNDISALSNFPLSPRLHTLLLSRNRINSIQSTLATSIPNLRTLILTSNNFKELADLDTLRHCTRLTHLSLLENPVTRKEHYRLWIIWRCPSVRFLDYQKVKDVERHKATELFGTAKEPSALASTVSSTTLASSAPNHLSTWATPNNVVQIIGIKSRTFDIPSSNLNGIVSADKTYRIKLNPKEKKRVESLIRGAKSLQEIARLEKELNEGRIPGGGVLGPDTEAGDEMEE